MSSRIDRRTLMRLAASGLSSALVPLSGCAEEVGQNRGTRHFPTPDEPFTPTEAWYWVAIQGSYEADRESYRLKVGGVVDRALSLSEPRLRSAFDLAEETITLACVGNSPNGSLMSAGCFRGVRMRDVIERAGVSSRASGAIITGLDGLVAYRTIEDLSREQALLVLDMGPSFDSLAPIPVDHGFPCRLLTPGFYGYLNPKWIDTIELVDHGGHQGVVSRSIPFFEGKMQLASGFSRPRGGRHPTGPLELLGYAFGDGRPIDRVEVRVDDGPWQRAEIVYNEIGDELPTYLWVLWRFRWNATVGDHRIACRAVHTDGTTQFEGRRFPYSGGSIASIELGIFEAPGEEA